MTKRTARNSFIIAETDHLSAPYRPVRPEAPYWSVFWLFAVTGELLHQGPRNTTPTGAFESKILKYEACLCAMITAFSQELSKSVPQWQFAVNGVGYCTVWMVFGVIILAPFASADRLKN